MSYLTDLNDAAQAAYHEAERQGFTHSECVEAAEEAKRRVTREYETKRGAEEYDSID